MVTVGGMFAVTVNVAALLVAEPKALVTTARNIAPLSDVATDAMVKLADVAPGDVGAVALPLEAERRGAAGRDAEGHRLTNRRGSGSAAAS